MKLFHSTSTLLSALVMTLASSCSDPENNETQPTLETSVYGTLPDQQEVKIFTLTNANGMTAKGHRIRCHFGIRHQRRQKW
jgi:hypothetical protein